MNTQHMSPAAECLQDFEQSPSHTRTPKRAVQTAVGLLLTCPTHTEHIQKHNDDDDDCSPSRSNSNHRQALQQVQGSFDDNDETEKPSCLFV